MAANSIRCTGPEIRAMLAGQQTQLRRVVKWPLLSKSDGGKRRIFTAADVSEINQYLASPQRSPLRRGFCPYGRPGDLLWVREAFAFTDAHDPAFLGSVEYQADNKVAAIDVGPVTVEAPHGCDPQPFAGPWKPSIHMPRWASRLTLRITDVRVERLQDISDEDARAEGVNRIHHGDGEYYFSALRDEPHPENWCYPTDAFREIWESLNGEGSWEADPFVWALSFSAIHKNIDEVK